MMIILKFLLTHLALLDSVLYSYRSGLIHNRTTLDSILSLVPLGFSSSYRLQAFSSGNHRLWLAH